jgi:hypothetical protein
MKQIALPHLKQFRLIPVIPNIRIRERPEKKA